MPVETHAVPRQVHPVVRWRPPMLRQAARGHASGAGCPPEGTFRERTSVSRSVSPRPLAGLREDTSGSPPPGGYFREGTSGRGTIRERDGLEDRGPSVACPIRKGPKAVRVEAPLPLRSSASIEHCVKRRGLTAGGDDSSAPSASTHCSPARDSISVGMKVDRRASSERPVAGQDGGSPSP